MLLRTVSRFALLGTVAGRATTKSFPTPQQHVLENHVDKSDNFHSPSTAYMDILEPMLQVLHTMQEEHFAPWLGTWPTAIDWTAAVMETHVSGALSSISRALDLIPMDGHVGDRKKENLVTLFFSQVLSYYFGQDHFAIRNEAYDDILWVVLGWLETIQFIDLHTSLNFQDAVDAPGFAKWHGNIWTPAFAHRARIFWNLARSGWDWELCGGGMTWNPRLEPYKNAITNELFISASASMYLYFPGDWNQSPFSNGLDTNDPEHFVRPNGNDVFRPHDPAFLDFAQDGYQWLADSGMMNDRGLYTDGFHISGYNDPFDTNMKCDVRNEQVYTYNQGVILTGQINLWKITGNYSYVKDGHRLIRNVIKATGWDHKHQRPLEHDILHKTDDGYVSNEPWEGARLPPWHGLGRAGVLEEACDSKGTCSQNSQTFKGIFFHHLTTFCTASISLDEFITITGNTRNQLRSHMENCRSYAHWLKHNVRAMMKTRDENGRVGMWWTAGLLGLEDTMSLQDDIEDPNAVDYRNDGVPDDPLWRRMPTGVTPPHMPLVPLPEPAELGVDLDEREVVAENLLRQPKGEDDEQMEGEGSENSTEMVKKDLNDRGRGRTVETQGSGLALLRAFWEIQARTRSSGMGESPWQPGDDDEL
ncbi:Mannan endo-1,6-alpha-mannosidase DCW1 [Cytospora mali]|uniref:Mannan endo-1,6-alpha-mannosidase DCW1 n=1 Tax=Cytospora mali TaxID=578113 RepID=A0A194V2R2_CYTMA|nr:Mannan endo-1,6-alpha-mannosidase DCW1 [Valsa mali var. pyri (nom. inval.)]